LIKYPKKSTIQQFTTGVLKKARCQEEKKAKHNTIIRELPNLLPPLHHSMTPMMKRRRRTPLLNYPKTETVKENAVFRMCSENKEPAALLIIIG
jgi:hypothetical protein